MGESAEISLQVMQELARRFEMSVICSG